MDELVCPLCVEVLDTTDLASQLCDCSFKVCLYCYTRLCEEDGAGARCPSCRSLYDQERTRRQKLDPKQLEEIGQHKGKRDERRKSMTGSRSRKDLANMRVVQRNLVYVVGLALDLCHEDTLKGGDYFGQFGRIVKISVSRAGPYGTATTAKNGPSGSAYVTYRLSDDARKCIATVHGAIWDGKQVKACYGTTKYCNAFLKGIPCNNTDCLYLHAEALDEDSYTKEQTKSAKFVSLVHAVSMGTPAAKAAAVAAQHALAPNRLASAASVSTLDGLETEQDSLQVQPSRTLSTATSWAARAAASTVPAAAPPQPAAAPPPPPGEHTEDEWPTLPGAASLPVPAGSDASAMDMAQAAGRHRGRDPDPAKPSPAQKLPASQWPALSSSPSSSWASAAEHLRPGSATAAAALFHQPAAAGSGQAGHHAAPSTGSQMSPLASSLHEDSDLQQDSDGLPDSSDAHQDGSQDGDDMAHLGDDADSARALALQQSPAGGQARPPPGFSHLTGLASPQPSPSMWQAQPLRSQSRFEFARQDGPDQAPVPQISLMLPPAYPTGAQLAPWMSFSAHAHQAPPSASGWPSSRELQSGLPTCKLPEWGSRKDVWGSDGATNRQPASSSCSQDSSDTKGFSLSSRHWQHAQPAWAEDELSLPASL